jgi:hypothetical protein
MDDTMKKKWGDQPDTSYDVVIVLRSDSEAASPEAMGVGDMEPIPYQPGMFKAKLTGAELLSLAERAEIDDISPDEPIQAL